MPQGFLSVIPTSVVDVAPQTENRNKRAKGDTNHGTQSSRSIKSHHPEEVSKLVYEFFLKDCEFVFDPFSGFGERGYWANHYGFVYQGFDISESNNASAKENFGVENELADSLTHELPLFNGVYTCPPYWNLERYDGGDPRAGDKIKTWEGFLHWYFKLWSRVISEAPDGSKFCIQVGNWRSKGIFYDLEYETQRLFLMNGCEVFDKVIISRKKTSKIKIMLPQAKRLGYSVKVHETLLVFIKSCSKKT